MPLPVGYALDEPATKDPLGGDPLFGGGGKPTPPPPVPMPPLPSDGLTVDHQPTAPMIPVIPSRRQSVTPPATSTPPPDAGGSTVAPVPNPTPATPAAQTSTNDPYARFAQQFTPQYDANGIPVKPQGTEDPNIAAAYYRMFANPNVPNGNPLFQYITPADVNEFRASGYQGNIGDWFLAKYNAMGPGPTGPNTAGINPTTPTATTPGSPTPPVVPTPAAGGSPPAGLPNESGYGPTLPTTPAAPGTPPTTPSAGTPPANPNDEIQTLIDQYTKDFNQKQPGIETMLDPMYARQRQNLQDDMRASAAATGEINSPGGFGENLATAESNLAGQQSADLAGKLSQEYLGKMQQNTALAGLATNAGMQQFVSELDNSFKLTQLTSQDSLAKWIDSADNILKKYGIDKNDVLQRYMTLTQSGDSRYAADQGVNAAALHAAAASAAANASTQAALQEAQMRQQLGMAELGVTRENNIGNFILGLINGGLTGINDISGLLSGFPPSSVVVKP